MNAAPKLMSADAFLSWFLDEEDTWELVNGAPVPMMTGATGRHDRIVVNVMAALHGRLRGGPCRPATDDIALRARADTARRPDVTVLGRPMRPTSLISPAGGAGSDRWLTRRGSFACI